MSRLTHAIAICGLLVLSFLPQSVALAHQPYCESVDLTAVSPWEVPNSSTSYAYFGALTDDADIDYFTFEVTAGQTVLLSLSIPNFGEQKEFDPKMVLYGPGVPSDVPEDVPGGLPDAIDIADNHGAMMIPVGDEPLNWFEPFGRRYYWNWDDYFFEAPETTTYTVALWHPEGETGRYAFVIGEEELRGGDPACMGRMDEFWSPLALEEKPAPAIENVADMHIHEDGTKHDHSELLEVDSGQPPFVDLQIIPLGVDGDDGYNVRVQTLNFTFAPQHVGMDPVEGEGYATLAVDGKEVARIYGEWVHLSALPDDAKMLSVGLHANNHQALAIDGEAITDMVELADVMSLAMASTSE